MGRRKWFPALQPVLSFWKEHVTDDHIQRGLAWYREAQREAAALAMVFGIEFNVVCAVIAVYSQNSGWAGNRTLAYNALKAWTNGEPLRGLVPVVDKATRILQTGDPTIIREGTSPKTWDFYQAILTGGKAAQVVVVDRWIARVSLDDLEWGKSVTPRVYEDAREVFLQAMDILGLTDRMTSLQFQAAVWEAALEY